MQTTGTLFVISDILVAGLLSCFDENDQISGQLALFEYDGL